MLNKSMVDSPLFTVAAGAAKQSSQPTAGAAKQSSQPTLTHKGFTLQQAHNEIKREREVRGRAYPKWVAEGKLSGVDATERFGSVQAAETMLAFIASLPLAGMQAEFDAWLTTRTEAKVAGEAWVPF